MLKLKKVKPLFTKIICTADKYTEQRFIPGTNLVAPSDAKDGLKEYQTVVAVGNEVSTVKVGDLVCINPQDYAVKKWDKNSMKSDMNDVYNQVVNYNFSMIVIDGKDHLLLKERDVDFIIEEGEEVAEQLPQIIKENTPKIIM